MVSSTSAREALPLTEGVADLEWVQTLHRDVQFIDVTAPGWDAKLDPYTVCPESNRGEIASRQTSLAVTDAKSVFDTLMKQTAGCKEDRGTAMALALPSTESSGDAEPRSAGSLHVRMLADTMTKSDVSRENAAPSDLLPTGRYDGNCSDENQEADERAYQEEALPEEAMPPSQKEPKKIWNETSESQLVAGEL